MSIISRFTIYKLLKLLGIEPRSITLIGNQQNDGYIFITSQELKGFSLMLEPGEDKNLGTLMDAVNDPLIAYLETLHEARHKAAGRRYEVRGFNKNAPHSYKARLSIC